MHGSENDLSEGKDRFALIVFAVMAVICAGAGDARRKAISRG
jgi:hypothetical protein